MNDDPIPDFVATAGEVDAERTMELTRCFMETLKENYLRGPMSRERVYESLNALAIVTAITIHGTSSNEAYDVFATVFHSNLELLQKHEDARQTTG